MRIKAEKKSNADDTVCYATADMKVDENGVNPFFWPLSYEEREHFSSTLLHAYAAILNEFDTGERSLNCYKLMTKYYICEAITIFWANALAQRFARDDRHASFPENFRIWPAVFSGQKPPLPNFLKNFKKEPATISARKKFGLARLKRILPLLKFGLRTPKIDGLLLKKITPDILEKDIIATQRTHLVQHHAKAVDRDVIFCRSDRWFKPVSDEEIQAELLNAHTELENRIHGLIGSLYTQANVVFDQIAQEHMLKIMSDGAAMLRIHENRLRNHAVNIPKTIWTGTAGITFDTLLRLEVMRRGGHAVGHDHGAGQGHVDNPITGLTELWGSNEYVTFNHTQATELSLHMPNWPNPDKVRPAIKGYQSHGTAPQKPRVFKKFADQNAPIKNVVFIASLYDGERGRMGPWAPDIAHVDWQARLIKNLRDWDYEVIFKIHPESKIFPPDAFTELGARIKSIPIEDMLDEVDILLFDCVYTSALYAALETNIPTVLVDFFQHPWTPLARKLFEKRSTIVEAGFDHANKKQLNWQDLQDAIKSAPAKSNNPEYFEYFYG